MPITEAQRLIRKLHIGSSDAGTLMGVNPYGTLGDLVLSKLYDQYELDLGEVLEIGNALEPGLVQLAADRLGIQSLQVGTRYEAGVLAANLDGEGVDAEGNIAIIETKTAGWMWDGYDIERAGWGEDGTFATCDELGVIEGVPAGYYYQVQHQIYCLRQHLKMIDRLDSPLVLPHPSRGAANAPIKGVLYAAINGGGMRLYHIPENPMVGKAIATRADEVWVKYVEPGIIPDGDDAPTENALKRIVRQEVRYLKAKRGMEPQLEPESPEPAELDEGLVEDYLDTKEAAAQAEAEEKRLRNLILSSMGDLDTGVTPGGTVVTYRRQSRTAPNAKLLQDRFPDIANQVMVTTSFPVMRVKTPKGD